MGNRIYDENTGNYYYLSSSGERFFNESDMLEAEKRQGGGGSSGDGIGMLVILVLIFAGLSVVFSYAITFAPVVIVLFSIIKGRKNPVIGCIGIFFLHDLIRLILMIPPYGVSLYLQAILGLSSVVRISAMFSPILFLFAGDNRDTAKRMFIAMLISYVFISYIGLVSDLLNNIASSIFNIRMIKLYNGILVTGFEMLKPLAFIMSYVILFIVSWNVSKKNSKSLLSMTILLMGYALLAGILVTPMQIIYIGAMYQRVGETYSLSFINVFNQSFSSILYNCGESLFATTLLFGVYRTRYVKKTAFPIIVIPSVFVVAISLLTNLGLFNGNGVRVRIYVSSLICALIGFAVAVLILRKDQSTEKLNS